MSRDFRKLEIGTKIILNAYFIPYVNICLHQTADATSATPRQNKNANPLHIVVPPSPTPFSFIRFRSVPVRLVSFDRMGRPYNYFDSTNLEAVRSPTWGQLGRQPGGI